MDLPFDANGSFPRIHEYDGYYNDGGENMPISGFGDEDIPGNEGQGEDIVYGIPALQGFQIFVCAVGILGNVAVILMILLLTEFKKGVTSWYILQLAIADTIFLLTLPFKVVEDQRDSWDFPEWMCQGNQSILFINYYCSVTFLTIMAIDRYIAICHSFSERLQKLRTHRSAYIATVIVWTVSILICIPIMIYSSVSGTKPNCRCAFKFPTPTKENNFTQTCIEAGLGERLNWCVDFFETHSTDDACKKPPPLYSAMTVPEESPENASGMGCNYYGHHPALLGLVYFNFVVMFILPFTIITVCYSLIIFHLNKTKFRSDSNASRSSHSKDDRSRKRVVVMCATLVAVFAVCWLPYHSFHMSLMAGVEGSADFCSKLFQATSLLIYLNSAINPFIYFIVARFKSNFKRVRKSHAASIVISLLSRPHNHEPENGLSNCNSVKGKQTAKIEEDKIVHETPKTGGRKAAASEYVQKSGDSSALTRQTNSQAGVQTAAIHVISGQAAVDSQ